MTGMAVSRSYCSSKNISSVLQLLMIAGNFNHKETICLPHLTHTKFISFKFNLMISYI